MKFALALALALAALSNSAYADGFACQTADGSLNVKLYNHTQPEKGTRVAAIMVLSDTAVAHGRKTIARFTEVNGVLSSRSSRYEANVDLRFNDSARKGELIMGTKLGYIDTIVADIDFVYSEPVSNGQGVTGQLVITKRDGSKIKEELNCSRYLKGE